MDKIKGYAYKDFSGEVSQDMFIESVVWVKSSYGGPSIAGEYYVSDGDGKIYSLYCTGSNHTGASIFNDVVTGWKSEAVWDKEDYCNLTDSELIKLYTSYNIWYETDDICDCENYPEGTRYIIHKEPPKYYLRSNLSGPIDTEEYGEPIITDNLDEYHDTKYKQECNARKRWRELSGALYDYPYLETHRTEEE